MTNEEKLYHDIAAGIDGAKEGKMFGALSIMAPNGKAAAMYWKNQMVFKLEPDDAQQALSLDGAHVFEPMAGRPMGGWILVPNEY